MASHQTQVGPWPIKRSQSAPDTSTRLFTPRNSPPSLAHLLSRIDEEHAQKHQTSCCEHPGQFSSDAEACSGEDKRIKRTHGANAGTGWVQGLILSGTVILLVVPATARYTYANYHLGNLQDPRNGPSSVWPCVLVSLVSMVVGMNAVIALFCLNIIKQRKSLGRRQTQTMLFSAFAGGIAMTTWTLLFVQPRIKFE